MKMKVNLEAFQVKRKIPAVSINSMMFFSRIYNTLISDQCLINLSPFSTKRLLNK